MPLFLDLRERGATQEVSWVQGGVLLGEYMTLNSTAYLNEEGDYVCLQTSMGTPLHTYSLTLNLSEKPRKPIPSKLSDILEQETDPKYNLSARACNGILNRANKRGKKLPEILQEALEKQAQND